MASDNEILFLVIKSLRSGPTKKQLAPIKVFRTRNAARVYAMANNAKSKRYHYKVMPASWGPEQ